MNVEFVMVLMEINQIFHMVTVIVLVFQMVITGLMVVVNVYRH